MNTVPGSRQTSLSRARHTLKYKLFTSPHPLFAQIEPFAASAVVAQMPIESDADFAHRTGLPESFLKTMLYSYGE